MTAVSGVVLVGFVLGDMPGNLQFDIPPSSDGTFALDAYAEPLQRNGPLLWGARTVILLSVLVHIFSAIQLAQLKNAARPVAYVRHTGIVSTYASRTI